ncbi:hypothetical protein [Dolichospermum compactum]|uniref:Uncharacterized protein n=1 Tax=Dolichospermum compactum NIES-806 TaxID=1973481 RepID=A0A1Z4V4Q5_9CYAN|nr:hypothetical protein [Dolichospermum compactum]BAZ86516.1 hypothetical protein NIES806_27290 [Dolichospermum compactum NIES-806]
MSNNSDYNVYFKLSDGVVIKKLLNVKFTPDEYILNKKIKLDDSDDFFIILDINDSYETVLKSKTNYYKDNLGGWDYEEYYQAYHRDYQRIFVKDITVELDFLNHKKEMEKLLKNLEFEKNVDKICLISLVMFISSFILILFLAPFSRSINFLHFIIFLFLCLSAIIWVSMSIYGLCSPNYNTKKFKPTKLVETNYTQ